MNPDSNLDELRLSLENIGEDSGARQTVVNLARNLNASGVMRATNFRGDSTPSPTTEYRGTASVLYALSLKVVEGAAVKVVAEGVINAARAAFASSQNKNIALRLTVGGKDISITAKNLSPDEIKRLQNVLETLLNP